MRLRFNTKKEVQTFASAQEAYMYLFMKLQEEGVGIEAASERAFKFSSEYAERMQLPVKTEIKEKGVRGVLQNVKIVSDFFKENPSIWEVGKPIVLGAISAIGGAAAGANLAESAPPEPRFEQITYDDEN
jgi:hypothetical protein